MFPYKSDALFDACQKAERPERRATRLTTISHCQEMVSHMALRAATYCYFQWSAFQPVGIKAVTNCTHEC